MPQPKQTVSKRRRNTRLAITVTAVAGALSAAWRLLPTSIQEDVLRSVFHPTPVVPAPIPMSAEHSSKRCDPEVRGTLRSQLAQASAAALRCDYVTARRDLLTARESYRDSPDPEGEAQSLIMLADIELRTRYQPVQAPTFLDYASRLESICDETHSEALVRVGEVHLRRREYPKATGAFQEVTRDRQSSARTRARAELGLAGVFTARKEFDAAFEQLAPSQRIFEELGDSEGQADVHLLLGALHREQTHPERALTEYTRAAELYAESRCAHPNRILALCALGDLKRRDRIGPVAANELYAQAGSLAVELGYTRGRAQALVGLALLDIDNRQFESARDKLETALKLYQQEADLSQQAWVHEVWVELCSRGNDTDCRKNHANQADRIYAQLPSEARPQRVRP